MISFIGQAVGTNTATMPTHQTGDLIVVFAYRDGSNTQPTIPAGYTAVHNAAGANTNSHVVAYKIAASGSETVGTFTNATSLVVHVYRGTDPVDPIGGAASGGASSTTVAYNTITLDYNDGTSWVAGFAGHRSVDTNLQNAPTNMTARSTTVDATDEAAGHDTNGGVTSWPTTNVSVSGTSSGWRSHVIEIKAYRKAEQLVDNFNDNSISSLRWLTFGTVAETNQRMELTIAGGTPNYHGIYTPYMYDFDETSFMAELVDAGNQSWASIEVELQVMKDANNRVFLIVANGFLIAYKEVAGTSTSITNTAYNSSTMRWLRIRESGSTTYWEYSADGSSWTTLHSEANPITYSNCQLELDAGNWATETGSSTVVWDNVNYIPPAGNPGAFFAMF